MEVHLANPHKVQLIAESTITSDHVDGCLRLIDFLYREIGLVESWLNQGKMQLWCRRGDSNPHEVKPSLGPEPSASANSATSATGIDTLHVPP